MTASYKTLKTYAAWEEEIRKSRFIAYVKPVETEAEASDFVAEIKARHKDATHNVPVYVIGIRQEVQRYSDDGEPSGTAGVPILEMIKKEGLTNLAVVVTRYFGGIKLGTGGLVRAYTQVAQKAFEKAGLMEKVLLAELSVRLDYSMHGKVQNFLFDSKYFLKETVFDDRVTLAVHVRLEDESEFMKNINNLTNGKALVEKKGEAYHGIVDGALADAEEA